MFTGVNVGNPCAKAGVCAEAVAIGAAVTAGKATICCIVAVTESGDPVPPCGVCRELIAEYGPRAAVLLMSNGKLEPTSISQLLPARYVASDFPNTREP